ncbi:HUA2-like protein 3 [Platanthera guangdongensis]|uniref:HUA2-like protein 3 n=1 Tax=Platanthera guangdongensis TaxID=2320717 RepID=A0ABR2M8V6_9ASPA
MLIYDFLLFIFCSAFCNYADIEAFTEEKKKSLLIKRQGKGSDFVRAVEEIIDVYESLKKQNLSRVDSDDGDNVSNALDKEHLEDAGINSVGKIVETSLSSSLNHYSESASVTDCGDMGRVDDASGSLLDFDNHNKNEVVDDSTKNISILDQLRKTHLSSIPTTRKRARDALLPRSITKSDSSLRRSRSSLVNRPCKSQKSSMQVDTNLFVRCSAVDLLLEGSRPKEQVLVRGEHLVSSSVEASSIATELPLEDIFPAKSEATDLDDANVLEFSGKVVSSDTDTGSKIYPDGNGRPIIKDGTPSNSLVIKSMREPYRKQVNSARALGEIDEIDAQSDDGSHSDSSNSGHGKTKKFSNEDGDGHLPLVKRARVRLGKTPAEERNLNGSIVPKVKLDNLITSNGHYESTTFSSPVNNFPVKTGPPKRPSPVTKEVARPPTNGSADDNTGRDLLSCKRNIHHLMLDVESALPPSKRLHRALEAMSANAAEAAVDCLLPSEAALDKNACALSPSLTSQNLAGCCLTSSEVKPDDSNSETLINTLQENSEEIITGRSSCQGSFTSNVTGTSKSSSMELIEKCGSGCEPNHSLSPKATDTCNSQQLTDLSPSGGAATVLSTTSTVCSASEIDVAAACSDIVYIDSSATDMNVILSVSSATDVCYLSNCMNGATAASVTTNFSSTTNDNSMSTISSRSHFEQSFRVRDM